MKNLVKKLGASVVAVLFCVICLSTTTFAWFSMNNSAKVEGMEIEAANENGYLIIGTDTINGKNLVAPDLEGLRSANLDSVSLSAFYESVKVKPVAHKTLTKISDADDTDNWYFHIAEERTAATAKEGDEEHVLEALDGYVLTYNLYIAIAEESVDMYDLKVSSATFTTTGTQEDLKKAIRVVVASENNIFEFNNETAEFNTILVDRITNTDLIALRVYVYIDGEYSTIYSNNFANLAKSSINFTLTASDTDGE